VRGGRDTEAYVKAMLSSVLTSERGASLLVKVPVLAPNSSTNRGGFPAGLRGGKNRFLNSQNLDALPIREEKRPPDGKIQRFRDHTLRVGFLQLANGADPVEKTTRAGDPA